MRRGVLLLASMVLAMLLASGIAFAAVIQGTPGDDKNLNGTPRGDAIYGYGGDDELRGYEGSDRLDGGTGNDRMRGMKGNDLLLGRAGRDTIYGQRGADRVEAGSGNDFINVARPSGDESDAVTCGRGYDTVFANRKDGVSRDCENVQGP